MIADKSFKDKFFHTIRHLEALLAFKLIRGPQLGSEMFPAKNGIFLVALDLFERKNSIFIDVLTL